MALSAAYVTVEEFKAATDLKGSQQDSVIERELTAVSRLIDSLTGDFFGQDASVQNRIYWPRPDGNSRAKTVLRVDPISTTTGFVIKVDEDLDGSFADETAWASTDYQLWPVNAALKPEVEPYREIFIPSWSTKSTWSVGYPVQVTARFGWPAVPGGIQEACIELTRILRVEGPRGTGRINADLQTVFNTSREAQSIIRQLLDRYSERVFA